MIIDSRNQIIDRYRRIIILGITAAVLFLFAGCGKMNTVNQPVTGYSAPQMITAEPTAAETPPPASDITEMPSTWTLTQHDDTSGLQCMFYTLYNEENRYLIVIDGGNPENEEHVRSVIREYGGVVNAWFVTHFHADHASAFNAIYADPGDISIEKVYTTHLDRDLFFRVAHEWDTPETYERFMQLAEHAENIEFLRSGQEFDLNGLHAEIFNAGDEGREELYGDDIPNNCSLVMKISGKKDSLLMCSDTHTDSLGSYLIETYGDRLKAEYVQTGHHGNNSFPTSFYDAVGASRAFLDSPPWVMTEEKYTAAELEEYFIKNGAEAYDFRTAPNSFTFE